MTFAILAPAQPVGTERVIGLTDKQITVPAGLTIIDVSTITPAPQERWITTDGGKTFTDPTVPTLQSAQAMQLQQLRSSCRVAIIGGFQSAALGVAHTYP